MGQVATVTMNTLCHIQYCIYNATHMELYASSLQLIFISDFHTYSIATLALGSQKCGPRMKPRSHISYSQECRRV